MHKLVSAKSLEWTTADKNSIVSICMVDVDVLFDHDYNASYWGKINNTSSHLVHGQSLIY